MTLARVTVTAWPRSCWDRVALAIVHLELNEPSEARALLEDVAAAGVTGGPRGLGWSATLASLAEVSARLGDTQHTQDLTAAFRALTRIRSDPWSTASARVSPSMPALAVAWGRAPRTARCALWEEMFTIAPAEPAWRKRRTAVADPTTARSRLRWMSAATPGPVALAIDASRNTAALLTQPAGGAAACVRSAA
jgi:hypothetical protein